MISSESNPLPSTLPTLKSLGALEVSPWSDLDQSLQNIPADKWLSIALHLNDVLCASAEAMRERLYPFYEVHPWG